MRSLQRATLVCGLVLALAPLVGARGPQRPAPAQPPGLSPPGPDQFIGTWDYNAEDSVNAATGRPEQSPRGKLRSGPGPAPSTSGRGGASPGAAGPGSVDTVGPGPGPGYGYGVDLAPVRPRGSRNLFTRELQELSRDLLEVPEALVITVLPDAVRFIDDIERERIYRTDNERARYQFGASVVDIRTRWDEGRLIQEIEGTGGFRMTETWFLSSDAARLFVIVRVGEQKKGAPVVGANRVYDRVVR